MRRDGRACGLRNETPYFALLLPAFRSGHGVLSESRGPQAQDDRAPRRRGDRGGRGDHPLVRRGDPRGQAHAGPCGASRGVQGVHPVAQRPAGSAQSAQRSAGRAACGSALLRTDRLALERACAVSERVLSVCGGSRLCRGSRRRTRRSRARRRAARALRPRMRMRAPAPRRACSTERCGIYLQFAPDPWRVPPTATPRSSHARCGTGLIDTLATCVAERARRLGQQLAERAQGQEEGERNVLPSKALDPHLARNRPPSLPLSMFAPPTSVRAACAPLTPSACVPDTGAGTRRESRRFASSRRRVTSCCPRAWTPRSRSGTSTAPASACARTWATTRL